MEKAPIIPINTTVIVVLDKDYSFDPWDGSREVQLFPYNPEKVNEIRSTGKMTLCACYGLYVGSRNNIIKIKPSYGLMHPESEYFQIPISSIHSIKEVKFKDLK